MDFKRDEKKIAKKQSFCTKALNEDKILQNLKKRSLNAMSMQRKKQILTKLSRVTNYQISKKGKLPYDSFLRFKEGERLSMI